MIEDSEGLTLFGHAWHLMVEGLKVTFGECSFGLTCKFGAESILFKAANNDAGEMPELSLDAELKDEGGTGGEFFCGKQKRVESNVLSQYARLSRLDR